MSQCPPAGAHRSPSRSALIMGDPASTSRNGVGSPMINTRFMRLAEWGDPLAERVGHLVRRFLMRKVSDAGQFDPQMVA